MDVIEEMIKDFERSADFGQPHASPYDLLRVCYWMKAALTEFEKRTPACSSSREFA